MNFTYEFLDSSNLTIKRTCGLTGSSLGIPSDPANTDYQTFLAWVAEGNEPLPYVAPTPIDGIENLAEAKKISSDSVRATAYSKLQPTDWVVTREVETGVAAPADITAYRTAIRTASTDKITTIESQGELSNLADYLRSEDFAAWPEAPAS